MKIINFEAASCERVRQQLDAYVSNELTAAARGQVSAHLGRCAVCAAALDTRQRVKQALQTAVARTSPAPAALRARIRREVGQSARPGNFGQWWLAVAAALLLMLGGLTLVRWSKQEPTPSLAIVSEAVTEPDARMLKIGLRNHAHCALGRDYSAGPHSFERMTRDLGPEFNQLLPLAQEHLPKDYAVMIAHHCAFEGRSFVHLILSNQRALLSLTLTKKNGETFDPNNLGAVAQAAGVPLRRLRAQELEVAGFETRDYLVFVVSNLGQADNLQFAEKLAPAVRGLLGT